MGGGFALLVESLTIKTKRSYKFYFLEKIAMTDQLEGEPQLEQVARLVELDITPRLTKQICSLGR